MLRASEQLAGSQVQRAKLSSSIGETRAARSTLQHTSLSMVLSSAEDSSSVKAMHLEVECGRAYPAKDLLYFPRSMKVGCLVLTWSIPMLTFRLGKEMGNPPVQIRSEGKTGMIMLRIKRIRRSGDKTPNEVQVVPEQVRGKRKFGEDCVGFVLVTYSITRQPPTLLIRFGNERPAEFQHPATWTVEPFDKGNPGSYVTFVFRYRSLGRFPIYIQHFALVNISISEFLEAQGIISGESELASPTTPGLSDASTLSSSNHSPKPSRGVCRTVVRSFSNFVAFILTS